MKFDHYDHVPEKTRKQVIRSQEALFGKILQGLIFRSVLEIGPGLGGFAEFCARRSIDYLGVEVNERLAAKLHGRGHKIVIADVDELDLGTGRFGLLFMSHVLEHFSSYAAVCRVLTKLKPHVNDNGYVVILSPDVRWCPTQFHIDPTHEYPTSLRSLLRLLADLGMPVIRSGHYAGRWLTGWRCLWLAHRLLPLWTLPDELGARIDSLFMTNCYVVARPNGIDTPAQLVEA